MKQRFRVTTLASILIFGAMAGPCLSWYLVGIKEAQRRAQDLIEEPRRHAKEAVTLLAGRVRERLEGLRDAESKRPFYHYQNLYHDPKGAYEGASVIPSPLAEGPADPFIRAYFQIDATGQLTMPTLGEGAFEADDRARLDMQRAILNELQPVVENSTCVANLRQSPQPQQQAVQQRVEVLDSAAWQQNVQAGRLYSDIKQSKGLMRNTSELSKLGGGKGDVTIRVSDFQWCTTPVGKTESLVALRTVGTPQGTLIQGFVIASSAVEESLRGAAYRARFLAGAPTGEREIATQIGSTGWRISVDAEQIVAGARARAAGIEQRFLRSFLTGVIATTVAGLCIVGLVWQTERLARQRSQFAASAAHELRTPLAGLRMYSEMLAEGLGDPSRAKEYARRVANEAERLGRVVANVLGFTRLERGMLSVHPERGDLARVVRECVARQQPALEAAGACVEMSIPHQLPTVRFDGDAVCQIVENLLDNAEKHTRSAANRNFQLSLTPANGVIALSVSDHGPGLPDNVRRRLFQPFERGNNADAPAGLGLGLVLVQALARAQGGDVTYADSPGGGALFAVTFPA